MTQSTYVSACDCQKPLPLIKTNYLSEFRTEIEKAKARENLGITDGQVLEWGKITGHIEDNEDLHKYIKKQQEYTYQSIDKDMPTMENITTIQEGIEYVLRYIDLLESSGLTVIQLKQECENLKTQLNNLTEGQVATNTQNIETINGQIQEINRAIQEINVAAESLEWIKNTLKESKTISLVESDSKIEVKLSQEENNALKANTDGLYVQNHNDRINELETTTGTLTSQLESLKDSVAYATTLPDTTTSPNFEGLTVQDVKNKSLTEIMDAILFPASVRPLVMPTLQLTYTDPLVVIGTTIPQLDPIWNQGDAGNISSEESSILFNGTPTQDSTYSQLGTYTHKYTIAYEQGPKLLNNRGEETDSYVRADSITTETNVQTTYPWYAGNTGSVQQQQLVPFNVTSEEIEIVLSGNAIIQLPGNGSQLISFMLDSGIGYQDVNLNDWGNPTKITKQVDGKDIPYLQWTKNSPYYSPVTHKIKFKLSL